MDRFQISHIPDKEKWGTRSDLSKSTQRGAGVSVPGLPLPSSPSSAMCHDGSDGSCCALLDGPSVAAVCWAGDRAAVFPSGLGCGALIWATICHVPLAETPFRIHPHSHLVYFIDGLQIRAQLVLKERLSSEPPQTCRWLGGENTGAQKVHQRRQMSKTHEFHLWFFPG